VTRVAHRITEEALIIGPVAQAKVGWAAGGRYWRRPSHLGGPGRTQLPRLAHRHRARQPGT